MEYKPCEILCWWICIVAATSKKWIEAKMKELGVTTNPDYKLCMFLDDLAMITIDTPTYGVIEANTAHHWHQYNFFGGGKGARASCSGTRVFSGGSCPAWVGSQLTKNDGPGTGHGWGCPTLPPGVWAGRSVCGPILGFWSTLPAVVNRRYVGGVRCPELLCRNSITAYGARV